MPLACISAWKRRSDDRLTETHIRRYNCRSFTVSAVLAPWSLAAFGVGWIHFVEGDS